VAEIIHEEFERSYAMLPDKADNNEVPPPPSDKNKVRGTYKILM